MWIKEDHEKLIPPPENFFDGKRWQMNFPQNEPAMIAAGWRDWTDAEIEVWTAEHPEPQPDRADFDAACLAFRVICHQIGAAIGVDDFRGGFDEMSAFSAHPVSDTLAGVKLAVAWSAAKELCVYEGRKIGLGQPDWWYDCWKDTEA